MGLTNPHFPKFVSLNVSCYAAYIFFHFLHDSNQITAEKKNTFMECREKGIQWDKGNSGTASILEKTNRGMKSTFF